MTFEKWRNEQDAIVLISQRTNKSTPQWIKNLDVPYYGAIGGGISNVKEIDASGNITSYAIHGVTNARYDTGPDKLFPYEQKYLEKIRKDGHRYKITSCSTSIGLMQTVEDIDTGEKIDNYDDL